MCIFKVNITGPFVRVQPASSVSNHHSAHTGDMEAFMAVGVPEGALPKRVTLSLVKRGEGES